MLPQEPGSSEGIADERDAGAADPPKEVILVVDDDRLMRGVLAEILRNFGYEIVVAADGTEALGQLQTRRFDLVITDLIMPQMSGLDLIRTGRQLDPQIDFVVITASNSVDIAVETLKAGAADYIVKPFHLEQIRIVVARALEMRRLRERARKADFYKTLAERDGLTGLLNYRSFQEVLRQELQRSLRYERNLSLLMVDVDKFKDLNDMRGHLCGDRVLQQIARLLDENCREQDYCCRYGGEEFAIVVPETDKSGALRLAERIRSSVELTKFLADDGPPLSRLTVSVGVATRPPDGSTPPELVEAADRAMYAAKALGRNAVVGFDPSLPRLRPRQPGGEAQAL
jgi:diguanylate cyclase (GGDEF)-like protein